MRLRRREASTHRIHGHVTRTQGTPRLNASVPFVLAKTLVVFNVDVSWTTSLHVGNFSFGPLSNAQACSARQAWLVSGRRLGKC